jgi:hypothetical protein
MPWKKVSTYTDYNIGGGKFILLASESFISVFNLKIYLGQELIKNFSCEGNQNPFIQNTRKHRNRRTEIRIGG